MPEQPHITSVNQASDYDHHAIAWESIGTSQKNIVCNTDLVIHSSLLLVVD